MWRYLKAAFWARTRVPGLGDIPLLAVAAGAFAITGFAFPPLWLLGFGVVGGLTFGLASSERFRRTVEAAELSQTSRSVAEQKQELISRLDANSRRELARVQVKSTNVLSLYQQQNVDEIVMDTNRKVLAKLEWLYLRMLLQRQVLQDATNEAVADDIESDLSDVEKQLKSGKISESLRRSLEERSTLLRERLAVAEQRRGVLNKIDSDLQNIEERISLTMEQATLAGKHDTPGEFTLTSQMLDARMFGTMAGAVSDLDEAIDRETS